MKKSKNYSFTNALLFNYGTKHTRTAKNLDDMRSLLSEIGPYQEIDSSKTSPLESVLIGLNFLLKHKPTDKIKIAWDVSTFTKQHILLLLKGLDLFELLPQTKLIYTEPKEYVATPRKSLTYGLSKVSVVPTFEGASYPSKKDLLFMFLGYEGERALALYELLAPNDCILIIPDPPYYHAWKGRTETMNSAIIAAVGDDRLRYVDSRNPVEVERQLSKIMQESQFSSEVFNYSICHLGTKPQLIGLYRLVRRMSRRPTILYGSPKDYYRDAYSEEIGRTWLLPSVS